MTDRYNVERSMRACLVGAIIEAKGNMKQVAAMTGLSRATCYRLIVKWKLPLKDVRSSARGNKLG